MAYVYEKLYSYMMRHENTHTIPLSIIPKFWMFVYVCFCVSWIAQWETTHKRLEPAPLFLKSLPWVLRLFTWACGWIFSWLLLWSLQLIAPIYLCKGLRTLASRCSYVSGAPEVCFMAYLHCPPYLNRVYMVALRAQRTSGKKHANWENTTKYRNAASRT